MSTPQNSKATSKDQGSRQPAARQVCPACGSERLMDVRQKIICERCKVIIETCCEGGRC